jgi:uncharacterized protein (DUF1330 family)
MNINRAAVAAILSTTLGCMVPGGAYAQTQPAGATPPPAYYISEFELSDPEGIRPYSAAVESTFTPFGGRYLVRGGKVVTLEGSPAKRVIMIAFPSLEQAQAWYDSPAYRNILPIRHRSATSRVFIMGGFAAAN